MHEIEARLESLGLVLPPTNAPVANYVPYVESGGVVYIAGQLPFRDGALMSAGVVGEDVTVEQAYEAARQCGLHLLTHLKSACGGDWSRVVRCIKLVGFVQAPARFTQHPEVINGASNLMVELLGDAGRHARVAVGAASLPRNACVEIEGMFAIRSV